MEAPVDESHMDYGGGVERVLESSHPCCLTNVKQGQMILQARWNVPTDGQIRKPSLSVIEISNPLHGRYALFKARNVLEFNVKAERR